MTTTAFRPEVRYARSGEVNIAYQVVGEGDLDLVLVNFLGNLVWGWEQPLYVDSYRRLASVGRLILFDKRGTGLSDRPRDLPNLETRMDDIRAVMDAAGSESATLLGPSAGGQLCALFAATYPERTRALVLHNTPLRGIGPYEYGSRDALDVVREARLRWGQRDFFVEQMRRVFPSFANDPDFEDWYVTHERLAASPGAGVAFLRMLLETDVRDVLPAIRVPTLLRYHDAFATDAEYATTHIRGSERIRLTLPDLALQADDTVADDLKRFLTARSSKSQADRVLATVLFTDLVDSTARAAEVGDAEWLDLLERFRGTARAELARFRGREIDTAGDGLFATFDGPARAIECARALVDDTRALGLELRAGVHTGECEVLAEKVAGIAVHIGARITSVAGASEVLVSSTVKDLVAGSGIEFVDSGMHSLKGIPGEWRLYAVR